MKLYSTLSRKIEEFQPLHPPIVNLYTCGPTVYDYTHIGHARAYINNDVLKRTLTYLGFQVKHVLNITDVGHLTGDDDTGEDKLERGAEKAGKSVWDVAQFYIDFFNKTIKEFNILPADITARATDCISDMIDLIKKLEEKGYVYETDEAVYFDTAKFKNYGKLSGQRLEEKKQRAREEVHIDPQKKNPADFALWFKRVGRFANHVMHWESPWGDGFPGWHIECSAIAMKNLGETIDIHAGGVDHISVHHENEIAQSEAATGKTFSRFWFHNEFLLIEGQKMSKSLNNFYTLENLKEKGIQPMALRFLFLQSHYRKQLNFTWKSAQAAQEGLNKLRDFVIGLKQQSQRTELSQEKLSQIDDYRKRFMENIANDLQMPQAISLMWEMLKSNVPSQDKLDLLREFDKIFGLKLESAKEKGIPEDVMKIAKERLIYRANNDFKKADELRKEIEKKGYLVEDLEGAFKLKKK